MILSRVPRLVTRGSLKHMVTQLMAAEPEGDRVLTSAHSSELSENFGWRAPRGNTSTAYLTGLLAGHRALSKGVRNAILDIGLQEPSAGARVFAVLRGALDAGLEVPHSKEVLPDESRVRGEHVASYAKQLASVDLGLYERVFSVYLAKKLKPEQLPEHFDRVKEEINRSFQEE